ncbi:MAG TPA: FAD-dependent oxidoreductase, partial [Nocardioides sp.]|nr:FAD-dependent oxidoreductase [Nocardioides sp.]
MSEGSADGRHDVIVVGGGQAGLAIGYFLAQQGRDFTILEATAEPAAAWRARWDSLRLFTSARYDALPGLAFPGDPDGYPGRDEVVEYLTSYARHFDLPVQLDSPVRAIRRIGGTYRVELDDRTYEADQVVVATGPFQVPLVPAIAERLDPEVVQLHSTEYRSPDAIPNGPVLVVGGGNTGFQIAEELSGSREVHLSIGSRQTPLPQRILGRDLFWYLDATGLIRKTTASRIGRRMEGRDTLIGSSPRGIRRRHGVRLHGRAIDAVGASVAFGDGTKLDVGAVIWATGFRVDHSWVDVPVFDGAGRLVHRRGVTDSPGLYFLGLTWQHTRGSALLGWVKDDAEYIAERISTTGGHFPTEIEGLPEAQPPELVELSDGDRFDLRIAPVAKRLGDTTVRMLAYNGSIPGPTLKVHEGSELIVDIENQGDMEATVHWHGLRLENRYDGTHETQSPIQVGERYSAQVTFPDPGVYWYHPHIREDYGQEMGLYANVLVEPADPDYWPPAHRELPLTLDDILLEDGKVAPFSRAETTYAAMGRFGDVLLVNGQTDLSLEAKLGEVVRLYLTNTANTRVFKVALPGARMKLVGGDSGRVEHEELVDEVVLAPSERVVIDVVFDRPGDLVLEHRTPQRVYRLAGIRVGEQRAEPSLDEQFEVLRTNADMAAERERIGPCLDAEPDKTVAFLAEMDMDGQAGHDHAHEGHDHAHATADGIEWEDEMVEVNRMTTPANMRWKIVDRETGAENAAIDWRFRVG